MIRRCFLQTLPAGLLAQPGRKVRLGVSTGIYQAHPMAEAARLIRAAGFVGAQVGMRFADARLDLAAPDWSYARRVRDVFGEAGVRVVAVDGYTNLVHPDSAVRERGVRGLKGLLEHVREFGTDVVATESGTFNPTQPRQPLPADARQGWAQFTAVMRELLKVAASSGSILAMEGSAATYIGTVEMVARMLAELPSASLKILWDAANYFDEAHIGQMTQLLQKMNTTFGAHIVLAHAKDVRLKPDGKVEWLAAGRGVMDYVTFGRILNGLGREIFVCLEYVKEPDVPQVKRYVERFV